MWIPFQVDRGRLTPRRPSTIHHNRRGTSTLPTPDLCQSVQQGRFCGALRTLDRERGPYTHARDLVVVCHAQEKGLSSRPASEFVMP